LIREIYPLEDFKKMSKHFVFVKINTDHQPNLSRQYNVSALPTIMFMKADGSVIHSFLGYRGLGDYIAEMNKARQMAGR
jgi:thioredoxin-like negative regulator of GroEL